MLIRYCKECGHHLNFQYGENKGYCPICDKEVTYKDTTTAAAEYMKKQALIHAENLKRAIKRNAPAEDISNIQRKVEYYSLAYYALGEGA